MTSGGGPPEKLDPPALWWHPALAPMLAQTFESMKARAKTPTPSTPKPRKVRARRRRRRRTVERVEVRLARAVPRNETERMFVQLLREQVVAEASVAVESARKEMRGLLRTYGDELRRDTSDIDRLRRTRRRIWSLERRLGIAQQTLARLAADPASRGPGRPGRSSTLRKLVLKIASTVERQLSDRSSARLVQQQLLELSNWMVARTGIRWTWRTTLDNIRSVLRGGTKSAG